MFDKLSGLASSAISGMNPLQELTSKGFSMELIQKIITQAKDIDLGKLKDAILGGNFDQIKELLVGAPELAEEIKPLVENVESPENE